MVSGYLKGKSPILISQTPSSFFNFLYLLLYGISVSVAYGCHSDLQSLKVPPNTHVLNGRATFCVHWGEVHAKKRLQVLPCATLVSLSPSWDHMTSGSTRLLLPGHHLPSGSTRLLLAGHWGLVICSAQLVHTGASDLQLISRLSSPIPSLPMFIPLFKSHSMPTCARHCALTLDAMLIIQIL